MMYKWGKVIVKIQLKLIDLKWIWMDEALFIKHFTTPLGAK